MKKFLVLMYVVINIILIVVVINILVLYDGKNKIFIDRLNGNKYDMVMENRLLERDSFINEIELDIGIKFDIVDEYDDIKKILDDRYDNLINKNIELVNIEKELNEQKNILENNYNNILAVEREKNTYIISNVPMINQYSMGYPTGCESATLTNLLRYWGVSVTMDDVVEALPKGELPYLEDDIRYGGNPYIEFVGHPNDVYSFGVYEKPIIQVANYFKPGIINGTGMNFDSVLKIVNEDRPVMVWVSIDMKIPYVSKTWIYKPTGEKISWMANEHALLVIGYNDTKVIVSDSYNGEIRYYDKNVFRSRYNTYGKRALYY